MNRKKPTKIVRKVTITLSDRDYRKLDAYAKQHRVVRPLAAKRLLHQQLASLDVVRQEPVSRNQLGLFDSLQIDIFDRTSKVAD